MQSASSEPNMRAGSFVPLDAQHARLAGWAGLTNNQMAGYAPVSVRSTLAWAAGVMILRSVPVIVSSSIRALIRRESRVRQDDNSL